MDTLSKPELLFSFFLQRAKAHYGRGEIVFDSKSKNKQTFYIVDGYVKSYIITNDGDYNILTIYGPGFIFPLGPALRNDMGRSPYHLQDTVYFEAITDIEVHFARPEDLTLYCNENPVAYREMLSVLVRNYELFLSRVEGSLMKHAGQRIAHQLLVLCGSFAKKAYGQYIIDVPLTHQDISDSLGMARETVSREMEKLKKQGVIDTKDRHVIILDIEKLREIIES